MSEIKVKFIVSEGIESQINGLQQRQVIINPVMVFSSKYIPTSLSLATTIVASGVETGKHIINLRINNCTKEDDVFNSGNTNVEINELLDNFVLSADLKNIAFETEGQYKVIFTIDGQEFEDTFSVKKTVEK
ncbi:MULTISPECIES: DUF6941 family protein [Lactococcus]|nr:hypothetical protein [Lactococcus fujiensis]